MISSQGVSSVGMNDELDEGVYDLILLNSVTDASGGAIDGNGDGTRGDAFVHRGSEENAFYKFRADWNGDNGTSVFDFAAFSYWFGLPVPNAPAYMDLNGDGGVSVFDFDHFASNFGLGVTFENAFAQAVGIPGNETHLNETPLNWGDETFDVVPSDVAPSDAAVQQRVRSADIWIDVDWNTNRPAEDLSGSLVNDSLANDVALNEFLAEFVNGFPLLDF